MGTIDAYFEANMDLRAVDPAPGSLLDYSRTFRAARISKRCDNSAQFDFTAPSRSRL